MSRPLLRAAPLCLLCVLCLLAPLEPGEPAAPTLEERLREEPPSALVAAAREGGDPARGALVFHQPALACARCHGLDGDSRGIGPDLAARPEGGAPEDLVLAVLEPSRAIRRGFEPLTVVTVGGEVITGLLAAEEAGALRLRDAARDFEERALDSKDVASREAGSTSLMPAGLANAMRSRGEFIDLIAFLLEVAEHGPRRARELLPSAALLAATRTPEYEKDVDHAGIIGSWGPESLEQGRRIYERLCVNCHGTVEQPGSLPTSLRFASGRFKNGADPYSIYRTLTHGFGMMMPQTWMVPAQKYDVIHYLREAYLRPHNPSQIVEITPEYLAGLPRGTTRGPPPSTIEPWAVMDYGPSMLNTIEVGKDGTNVAYKGLAVRLDPGPGGIARGRRWILYEHDTMRVAACWSGEGFIDFQGIHFDGRHGTHPHVVGDVHLSTPDGPGWADPETGGFETASFEDKRLRGRDGRPYGPLPAEWARFEGLWHHGAEIVLAYRIGATRILESPGLLEEDGRLVFTRTLEVGARPQPLVLVAAVLPGARLEAEGPDAAWVVARGGADAGSDLAAGVEGAQGLAWSLCEDERLCLAIPAGEERLRLRVSLARIAPGAPGLERSLSPLPAGSLAERLQGGAPRWPERLRTKGVAGSSDGPFQVDVLAAPVENPWHALLRLSGHDFLDGGRSAVVSTWDGDVWRVDGLDDPALELTWSRIASGLFQPLGIKVIAGRIHVACRDQIAILHDLDGDGETDRYECFNSDHQVTDHFHEFAMDLQVDAAGNLYYTKGARHALEALVPQHGTLLRVSPDGARTDILATGFRAPNGVCLNPDGTYFVTDQEGHWIPKNRINWVRPGRFYGNFWGYHDLADSSNAAMEPPLCWITNRIDRSPAELLRVPEGAWGSLSGALLSLSYGYGTVFVVPHERAGDLYQGGVSRLPIPAFPTGTMRGRFLPGADWLYLSGMFAWAGNQEEPGGFYRVRATGRPIAAVTGFAARTGALTLRFACALDAARARDSSRFGVKAWSLRRSQRYGSDHVNEHEIAVEGATLSPDGRSVTLRIPELAPTWCIAVSYDLAATDGSPVTGELHGTIHELHD